jgi:hypothetical protein
MKLINKIKKTFGSFEKRIQINNLFALRYSSSSKKILITCITLVFMNLLFIRFVDINVNFFVFFNAINISFINSLINDLKTMKAIALNLIKYLLGIFSIIY